MKIFLSGLMSFFFCTRCLGGVDVQQVEFVYFNLSTNEIWVTGVTGLPADASPRRLIPVHHEDQLSEKSATFLETVRVADKLDIVWQEGGQMGWPGGDYVPKGASHALILKRDDLKIPAKLKNGKVSFTYLGSDKWRVKFIEKRGP